MRHMPMLNLLFAACLAGAQTVQNFMPAGGEVAGYSVQTAADCYSGLVGDTAQLYPTIDGGADVYLQRGFVEGAYEGFTKDNNFICIQIFDQGIKDSALSVFAERGGAASYENVNIADTSRLNTAAAFDYHLDFVNNKYYVYISTSDKTDELKNGAIAFAGAINAKMPAGSVFRPVGVSGSLNMSIRRSHNLLRIRVSTPDPQAALRLVDATGRIQAAPALRKDDDGTLHASLPAPGPGVYFVAVRSFGAVNRTKLATY
ncbi:MAG: hypothetical protein GF398_20145 [Chitinivibrionales bacterium]|nr:hypothetical protein [Chitinivibrionales bacterium]